MNEVFEAVNGIVRLWKEKQAEQRKMPFSRQKEHPLDKLNEQINQITNEIIESARQEEPPTDETETAVATGKSKLSVKELARIEREKEKGNQLSRDLEEVRKKRAEANRKLQEAQARKEPPKPPPPRISTNSVRWKDGLRTGKPNPELLESVRVFDKYQTAAGDDVQEDPVEINAMYDHRNIPTESSNQRPEHNDFAPPSYYDYNDVQDKRREPYSDYGRSRPDPMDASKPQPKNTQVFSTESISSSFTMLDKPRNYSGLGEQSERHPTTSFASLDQPSRHRRVFPSTSLNTEERSGHQVDRSNIALDARGLMRKIPYGSTNKKRRKRIKKKARNQASRDGRY